MRRCASNVKTPIVYTNVLVRDWRPWVRLGVHDISAPMSFHSRVKLDFPVSLGGYRHARDPAEPICLHLVHVPGAPNQGLDARAQFRIGQAKLLETTFADFEARIRDELDRMLGPGGFVSARDIAAITVNRWPHGYGYVANSLFDRDDYGEVLARARQKSGRVAIANSDAGGDAYAHLAIDQAARAVRRAGGVDGRLFTDHYLEHALGKKKRRKAEEVMLQRREFLAVGSAAMSALALAPRPAIGQSRYPERPIRLVIPYPPGGVYDSTGRPWAEKVKALLGTIVIENIGGAGSSLGTAAVARAQPDGYAILLAGNSGLVINPIAAVNSPYDPVKDFEPISNSRSEPDRHRGSPLAADEDPERADRLCQEQSGQAVVRVFRRGYGQSPGRRAIQVADRNRHRACALSGSGARHDRPHQRAHPDARAKRDRAGDRIA